MQDQLPFPSQSLHRDYRGEGRIIFDDDSILECVFDAIQLVTGNLHILCDHTPSERQPLFGSDDPFDRVIRAFEGTTLENMSLFTQQATLTKASHQWSHQTGHRMQLIMRCGKMTVTAREDAAPDCVTLRFYLANLTIQGDEVFQVDTETGTSYQLQLPIDIDGFRFVFRPINQYRERVKELKATRGINVTCELIVKANSSDEDRLVGIVNDLCLLLTLARGCQVTWLSYDVEKQDGTLLKCCHLDAITKHFGTLQLIATQPPEDTRDFLQKCYPVLQEQKERWQLWKAIQAYTDGKTEGDYLESRALKLVVVAEHLKGRFLEHESCVHILPVDKFEKHKSMLKAQIRQFLADIFRTVPPAKLDMMTNHADGMNWYPFRRAIKDMCIGLGLQINSRDRSRFVRIRNELVHRMGFLGEDDTPWDQYRFIMTFIGKILLAILRYDGHYYDWTMQADGWVGPDLEMRVRLELDNHHATQRE